MTLFKIYVYSNIDLIQEDHTREKDNVGVFAREKTRITNCRHILKITDPRRTALS